MTAGSSTGFDVTFHLRRLCCDVTCRLPDLSHVDMDRVAVSFAQTRVKGSFGFYATMTPLRFPGGQTTTVRRGRRYRLQPLHDSAGREMLYLLNFFVPRFLDLPLRQKMLTTVHELWHVSPAFDGDVRRFEGRCFAHGSSRKKYDAVCERMAERYWSLQPPRDIWTFLEHDFKTLSEKHGHLFGTRYSRPRLLPVE